MSSPDSPPSPLAALGWDDGFAASVRDLPAGGHPGRVSRADRGGILTVETASGRERARLAARFRRVDDPTALPTVGDWVLLSRPQDDSAPIVTALLSRRSAIIRQAPADRSADAQVLAANVDTVFVVASLAGPVNQRRLDRYLALARQSGAEPVIVLSQKDRCDDVAGAAAHVRAGSPGVAVLVLSAVSGEGIDALAPYLEAGRTAVLLGLSGAGKSTLANRLLGSSGRLATRAVRDDGRGRHTTTHRELLALPDGGVLIDTPGLRELGLWDTDEPLGTAFGDIDELAAGCRFGDCAHEQEPGCAVQAALADGSLDAARFDSYRTLERERQHLARKQDARLRRARRRGNRRPDEGRRAP